MTGPCEPTEPSQMGVPVAHRLADALSTTAGWAATAAAAASADLSHVDRITAGAALVDVRDARRHLDDVESVLRARVLGEPT